MRWINRLSGTVLAGFGLIAVIGPLDYLVKKCLMADVHAIEIADGQRTAVVIRTQIMKSSYQSHGDS